MRWLLVLMAFLVFAPSSIAQCVTVADLLLSPDNFDNQKVVVVGEVLGILYRGEKAWVNIENGEYQIGIWCETRMLENLKVTADYRHRGDIVEVIGIFHKACPEHGGDPDIHAENLAVLERGYEISREINWWLMTLSLILLALGLFLTVKLRYREKRALPYWY